MELTFFRFLTGKFWSYYATINVVYSYSFNSSLTRKYLFPQDLIFVSLMGMMEGNIYSKYNDWFLNFLVFRQTLLGLNGA